MTAAPNLARFYVLCILCVHISMFQQFSCHKCFASLVDNDLFRIITELQESFLAAPRENRPPLARRKRQRSFQLLLRKLLREFRFWLLNSILIIIRANDKFSFLAGDCRRRLQLYQEGCPPHAAGSIVIACLEIANLCRRLVQQAKDLGCDGVLSVIPYYNKPTQVRSRRMPLT